jgi:hypothetical protein
MNSYVKNGACDINEEHSVGRPYVADFRGFLAATESSSTIASTRLTERLKHSLDNAVGV